MSKKNLILARYNEDILWALDKADKIYLYNKGNSLTVPEDVFYKELFNVGREADTYLKFIVSFYEQICPDEIYIFSQADPFVHNGDFIDHISDLNDESQYPISLSASSYVENFDVDPTSDDDVFNNGIPFKSYYNHLFYDTIEDEHLVYFHALWAVRGSDLLFRSKAFYEHCLNLINPVNNPLEAHIFERMWQYIFDGKTLDWFTHRQQFRSKFIGGMWGSVKIQ
jgi:hypothetical protein